MVAVLTLSVIKVVDSPDYFITLKGVSISQKLAPTQSFPRPWLGLLSKIQAIRAFPSALLNSRGGRCCVATESPSAARLLAKYTEHVSRWPWVKIKPPEVRRFYSMLPCTRVPFRVYPFLTHNQMMLYLQSTQNRNSLVGVSSLGSTPPHFRPLNARLTGKSPHEELDPSLLRPGCWCKLLFKQTHGVMDPCLKGQKETPGISGPPTSTWNLLLTL